MNHSGKKPSSIGTLSPVNPSVADVPLADRASLRMVDAEDVGQRIDNYLFRLAKGVPRSHVYRIIRGGEVRVNRKRVDATYRIAEGDVVRIPPLRIAERESRTQIRPANFPVLYEDDALLIINKPAGVAVHGGSGVSFGVVEQLRAYGLLTRPAGAFLELVHRLDRDTSGVLLLAKRRSALNGLHTALREGTISKLYHVLVAGDWTNSRQHVRAPLEKYLINNGERRVRVSPQGSPAHTIFNLRERFALFSLLEADLLTGRTHQIRVHLAHLGFPVVGDMKYGDHDLGSAEVAMQRQSILAHAGFKRMFLHATCVKFVHPLSGEPLTVHAPMPVECMHLLEGLRDAQTF